jgi:ABC-type sugar transport system ATPase subunit
MSRRVAWVAELLEIADVLDRRPAELSGGQRQRVAMGRALVREPDAFLLDEPLSNLDARLRAQVRLEIAELQKRTGATMIYVTHDQVEAMTLGQRVAVLERGQLQQVAPPRELYDHPANTFVAGFIGSPPMNLFPTLLARDGAHGASVRLGGEHIAVPADRLPPSAPELRGRITAGIRPESIRILFEPRSGTVAARVKSIERLGHESLVTVEAPAGEVGAELVARVALMPTLAPGDTVYAELDPHAVHLFAPDGRAVTG